jgi:hypothetical protein
MSGYLELSEPMHSGETEQDWVDFPASPDPDPWATLLRGRRPDVAGGGYSDARRVRGAVATALAITLRGLLVTTIAVAAVAYLLLTNSHI